MDMREDRSVRAIRAPGRAPRGYFVRRVAEMVAAAWLLAACTFPFGNSPDGSSSSDSLTPRERNSLYLKEQEQEMRRRQGPNFDLVVPNR